MRGDSAERQENEAEDDLVYIAVDELAMAIASLDTEANWRTAVQGGYEELRGHSVARTAVRRGGELSGVLHRPHSDKKKKGDNRRPGAVGSTGAQVHRAALASGRHCRRPLPRRYTRPRCLVMHILAGVCAAETSSYTSMHPLDTIVPHVDDLAQLATLAARYGGCGFPWTINPHCLVS